MHKLLHDSPWRGVLHLTGGGAGFLSELLGVAGASRTVLEARVPYATASLAELLGGQPDQACSDPTARALAMAAFQRALKLAGTANGLETGKATASLGDGDGVPEPLAGDLFGFGATASLATDRAKRGPCRAHIAVQTLERTCYLSVPLAGDRPAQETALVEHSWRMLLQSLQVGISQAQRREDKTKPQGPEQRAARGSGSNQREVRLDGSRARRPVEAAPAKQVPAQAPWRKLILGASRVAPSDHDGKLLFPGAFNPLHEGHRRMMAIAEAKTGLVGAYELSVENIDKPLLDYAEIQRRLAQFKQPAWLTRLPTFAEKAKQFPGATFILGIDTLMRIADPSYYGGNLGLNLGLKALAQQQARFLVFGRVIEGAFQGLGQTKLPQALRRLCREVSEGEFRADLSSTELRRR